MKHYRSIILAVAFATMIILSTTQVAFAARPSMITVSVHHKGKVTTSTVMTFTFKAFDGDGLGYIRIYVDGIPRGGYEVDPPGLTSLSYSMQLGTYGAYSSGTHTYYATAQDLLAQLTTSRIGSFTVP